jgi:hypothetical protein
MLAFLHTAPVHVGTFDALVRELDASIRVRHDVREELLARARTIGPATDEVRSAVHSAIGDLAEEGARVVVCTCSTLGAAAATARVSGCRVIRVDRPVVERAARSGRRVLVVAALPTALEQTRALLAEVASELALEPRVAEAPCFDAWHRFEAGDIAGYLVEVAAVLESSAVPGDFVLLAQASMAPVAHSVRMPGVEIASSPRPGVEAALAAYRASSATAGGRP